MKKTLQNNWQSILLTLGGVALVFGVSILLFAPRDTNTIPDPDPEVIERNTFTVKPGDPVSKDLPQGGPLVISPATISVQNASPGLELPPLNIQNQAPEARQLRIDFAPIYRTNSLGVPVILADKENAEKGAQYLRLQPSGGVRIGPGETLQVQPTLLQAPEDPTLVGSIGVTILGEKEDPSDPQRAGVQTQVRQNVRLSALLYAVFPGGTSDRVQLQTLRADPLGGPGRLRVMVGMQSEGDVPALARGSVSLSSESGQIVRQPLIETTVLPGQKSSTSSEAFEGLKPGRYEMEARMVIGQSGQSLRRSLLLDSRGLPAVAESSSTFAANPRQTLPGRSVTLSLRSRNTGEKPFTPETEVALYPYNSQRAVSSRTLSLQALAPGDTAEEELVVRAPQKPGAYTYTATIRSESGEILEEQNASLIVGAEEPPKPGPWDSVRDWISDNPGGGMAVGAILAGALLLLLTLILRIFLKRKA